MSNIKPRKIESLNITHISCRRRQNSEDKKPVKEIMDVVVFVVSAHGKNFLKRSGSV